MNSSDDHHFALLHHVVLVTVVQMPRTQRRVQVVHQGDVCRVVERRTVRQQFEFGQQLLGLLVSVFGQKHLMRLLVHSEVAGLGDALAGARIGLALLPNQQRHDLVDRQVQVGVVLGLPTDDQRCARLVDEIESTSSTMA